MGADTIKRRSVIPLWANDNAECHGGENNGGARRIFCPANARYSELAGLSSWRTPGRRAFGSFFSGNPVDMDVNPNGAAGTVNVVDYVTGMPDLRSEHFHAIDCAGYDRMTIVWACETLEYQGLAVNDANVPNNTDNYWADQVFAMALGTEVVGASLPDYVNFPPGMWANRLDSLANEGLNSSSAAWPANPLRPGQNNRPRPPFGRNANSPGGVPCHRDGIITGQMGALAVTGVPPPGLVAGDDPQRYQNIYTYGEVPTSAAFPVGQGALQKGRTFKDAAGNGRYTGLAQGDFHRVVMRVGYPKFLATVTGGPLQPQGPVTDLSIRGLARVYFVLCSVGVAFVTAAPAVGPEYLLSTPVGPAVAPRQRISGRMFAVLDSLTPGAYSVD